MIEYEEKEYLDLLKKYKSDEATKARRNLCVVAFVVIAAWLLNVKISNVKVLRIDLSMSSEMWVLIIALVLLAYWAVMFYVHYRSDEEIQKEQTVLLDT